MNAHDVYVIHYGEVALKGKNRDYFERRLISNINWMVRRITDKKAKRRYGRIVLEDGNPDIAEKLRKIPGIKYFARAKKTSLEMDEIKRAAVEVLPAEFSTFRVDATRSNKSFPLNSMEINREIGGHIAEVTGKAVKLKEPDVTVYIEICEKESYVYIEKVKGIGGLPVGTAGKVVALVSGGIDSPVAAFMMMKRGCAVVAVHFFNQTLHSPQVRRKIEMLAEKLAEIQGGIRLYMVPFGEVQREIIKAVPAKWRMLIYRRSMMRMANLIAKQEKASGLVTGDNLAQVASQTLHNLDVIYKASTLPVLPPLIGFDKEETINIAKQIGTYEISIMPYEDCCSLMIAKHPETRGNPETAEQIEKGINFHELEKKAVEEAEIREFGL
jgi:thiamine biosynthesis protein ThiI